MVLVSEPYILTSACRMVEVTEPYILTSACRMVLVSEPYILASSYRMVQVSKPCRYIDLTMHIYATLINDNDLDVKVRRIWYHIRLLPGRSYALCLVCNICATPVLTRDRGPVTVTPTTMFSSTLIDALRDPVPRF